MTESESYPHGAPAWADLATSDNDGAKAFYTGLFGWKANDVSPNENMSYTMYSQDGSFVAASFQDDPAMSGGAPPRWQVHISVDDVDAVVKKVKSEGGKLYGGPFDVSDSGRLAAVSDPQGAHFILWQPKKHIGAGLMGKPGSIAWFELNTTDSKAAAVFYEAVLGCSTSRPELMPPYSNYTMLSVAGKPRAGIIQMNKEWGDIRPHWMVYLSVEDIEAGRAMVTTLGGENTMDVVEITQGKFCVVKDPQGAHFTLFQQNPEGM